MFDLTRSILQKKFSRKFAKLVPGLKWRPKKSDGHPSLMN